MAFVLPNGVVVDPDRDDREMILRQIAQRRQIAAQDRASDRQTQTQNQIFQSEFESNRADRDQTERLTNAQLAQRDRALDRQTQTQNQMFQSEFESNRAERDQTERLTKAQLDQQERLVTQSELSLDKRLERDRVFARDSFAEDQLRKIDAEEEQAGGVAKRLNDMIFEWDSRKPDAVRNPQGFSEWQIGRSRIRSQIPVNYEGAMFERNGVWKVDPGFFKVKRSQWLKSSAAGSTKLTDAGNPLDEVLSMALTNAGRSFIPSSQIPIGMTLDLPQSSQDAGLARALSQWSPSPTMGAPVIGFPPGISNTNTGRSFIPSSQIPIGMTQAVPQSSQADDLARALVQRPSSPTMGAPVGGFPPGISNPDFMSNSVIRSIFQAMSSPVGGRPNYPQPERNTQMPSFGRYKIIGVE